MAVPAHGKEADDLLRIWQTEAEANGEDYVICSIDKDLKCMPGRHLNIKKNVFSVVTPEEATRFYYEQILQGDPTDNIKGVPNIGPKKAKSFLERCNSESEFQSTVVSVYHAAFEDDWEKELKLNGSLIHLLRTEDDKFSIDSWPRPDLPESITATKPENTPLRVLGNASDGIHPIPSNYLREVINTEKPKLNIPVQASVPLPVFNPNWGKKNV
jgi:5'-3' exonuclease